MISDKERRRAVAELREASAGAYRHVDSLDVIAGAVGVEVAGKFSHEVEDEAYAALADFIDRPTCETIEHGRPDESHVCKSCSRCSYGWFEDIHDKPYSYCPNCGAEVVEGD